MESTLRSFLLFLGRLVSFFRKRWDQSTRRLWYIFAFLRSRLLPPRPEKRGEIRRSVESRPENPPTVTVICASRLPPPALSPIVGGDTPMITSPIPIQIRKPTDPNFEGPLPETQENYTNEHLGVDGYHLEGTGTISRSHNSAGHRDENEYNNIIVPQSRDDLTSNSPVIHSLPVSRPPSQNSYRQPHHAGYPPPSQYPQRPASAYSHRSASYLNGAEATVRGYPHAPSSPRPSPAHSLRPSSIAGSVTSQVYHASRPTTRVPLPSPMRNVSRRRGRSSTRQSMHEGPPEASPLPKSGSRTPVSTHPGPHSAAVSLGPVQNPLGRLRPMIGIDRYKKHKPAVEDKVNLYEVPPVTTKFVR